MPDFDAVAGALRQHLIDHWTHTPIAFENDDFEPDRPGGAFTPGGPWVFLEVAETDGFQVTMGAATNVHRRLGVLGVSIHVPLNSKVGLAEQRARQLRELYGGSQVPGVTFLSRRIIAGQRVERNSGRWWAIPFVATFRYDTIE